MRERLRELASLRAIALSRGQLVGMVFVEALLLAILGWGMGLILARVLLGLGTVLAVYLNFFQAGAFADYPLGGESMLIALACAVVGSLAAAVLPAWKAARLRPLDILGGQGDVAPSRFPTRTVAAGVVLVLLNPILVLLADTEPLNSLFASTFQMGFAPPLLGSAALVVGLALVTPGFLRLVEALVGPVLAWLLRLDRVFLRQQLTGNLWRSVGTTISLSAGLALFATALIWGYSMLVPFTPDESLPRMLVSILPAGVPETAVAGGRGPGGGPNEGQGPGGEAIAEIRALDVVVEAEVLPMAVEQPRLTEQMLASEAFSTVDQAQEHVLFMGVEPERAFGGDRPVLGFHFLQGDRATATRKLVEGRYCLVPDHFHTQTGLGVGDKFSVDVPNVPGKSVEYEIAGVVYIPGWNWFTKFADMRRRSGRALAVVFADYTRVKSDFALDRVSFFWMNAEARVGAADLEKALLPIADKYVAGGVKVDLPGAGEATVGKQYIRITEKDDLKARLFNRANDVIWSLTRFPLFALIIASLAVFNAVFASVRARYWQFGILRGVGLSRSQLFRLVMSESLMIFLAAGLMSLAAGALLAWSGIHICTYFFFFAGRTPPLVFPWAGLSLGFGIAFGLCFLAGLIPAWQAARREPLDFIQAGRSAAA